MSAVGDDTAALLAAVDEPKAHLLEVAREPGLKGLFHRPWPHRRLPLGLLLPAARLRATLEGLVPGPRAAARRRTALALGRPAGDPVVRRRARRALRCHALATELTWRPEVARSMPVHGLERLEALRAEGRGVVIASVHLGPFLLLPHALGARGIRVYFAGG